MSGKEKKADSGSSSSALPPGRAVSVSSVDLGGEKSSRRGGFRINVSMERSRPGMLMSVLEAFEALGLDVLDADVSCADDTPFRLQATGGQGTITAVDEQMVEQAVLQAITKCMEEDQNNDGDE
jgi:UTP:GlnB (protein PII) uridylyltransferase